MNWHERYTVLLVSCDLRNNFVDNCRAESLTLQRIKNLFCLLKAHCKTDKKIQNWVMKILWETKSAKRRNYFVKTTDKLEYTIYSNTASVEKSTFEVRPKNLVKLFEGFCIQPCNI